MPHVTLIYPCVGRSPGKKYIRSWQMQPLSIAILASLTPPDWDRTFFDDRLEQIDYSNPTDLVAISIESFTARRGYQIASKYRRHGVPVVMGGYHATACPDEVLEYADGVCVGEAEGVWDRILFDAKNNRLNGKYQAGNIPDLKGIDPDRSIFNNKDYFKISLVETSRGCPNACRFCSITSFHKGVYRSRPIDEVINEIKTLPDKTAFLIDDNINGDLSRARKFFQRLKPLKINWVGQASINIACDEKLLDLIVDSGCVGLLIGFESLSAKNLSSLGKSINRSVGFRKALKAIRKRGIAIYGTFMFGLPDDSIKLLDETVRFAKQEKFFLAAFNHVVPFPGTPLYKTLEDSGQLTYEKWWLSSAYRFGQTPFQPECASSSELEEWCYQARKSFYSILSIFKRGTNFSSNCNHFRKAIIFFGINILMLYEVNKKRGIPLGCNEDKDIQHAKS